MKKQYLFPLLIIISLLSLRCQKEFSKDRYGSKDPVDNSLGTVHGNIFDEDGLPAVGVTISVGDQTTETDQRGYFRVTEVGLNKSGSVVVAEKPGYFKGIRSFLPVKGTNQVNIKLLKKELIGTIGSSGGKASFQNGASVSLQSASVQRLDGAAYSGDIKVYGSYIDPGSADIVQTLPGSYMAVNSAGRTVSLISYGMLAIELETNNGERLQLKEGKPATLRAPIPQDRIQSAPAVLSMWYVDEKKGIWVEEGKATRQGNEYIGNVKHFSFWNYDIDIPAVNLSLRLKNAAGNPIAGVPVRVTRLNGLGQAYGYTSSDGGVSGLVPKGERLWLAWLDDCNAVIDSMQVGPFETDTDLGNITVVKTSSYERTIKGKLLDCNNEPVKNGDAIIFYDDYYRKYAKTNDKGEFTISWFQCSNSPLSVAVIGVDYDKNLQSDMAIYTIVGNVTDFGSLTACVTNSQAYFNYKLDNINYVSRDSMFSYSYGSGDPVRPYITVLSGRTENNDYINLSFKHNETAGAHPVVKILVNDKGSAMAVSPFSVNIVNYPVTVNDFWEGNFSGNFTDSSTNKVHSLSGSFRVRK